MKKKKKVSSAQKDTYLPMDINRKRGELKVGSQFKRGRATLITEGGEHRQICVPPFDNGG